MTFILSTYLISLSYSSSPCVAGRRLPTLANRRVRVGACTKVPWVWVSFNLLSRSVFKGRSGYWNSSAVFQIRILQTYLSFLINALHCIGQLQFLSNNFMKFLFVFWKVDAEIYLRKFFLNKWTSLFYPQESHHQGTFPFFWQILNDETNALLLLAARILKMFLRLFTPFKECVPYVFCLARRRKEGRGVWSIAAPFCRLCRFFMVDHQARQPFFSLCLRNAVYF